MTPPLLPALVAQLLSVPAAPAWNAPAWNAPTPVYQDEEYRSRYFREYHRAKKLGVPRHHIPRGAE